MNKVDVFCNAALEYAALGWAVFPLKKGTKDGHLTKSWSEAATTDADKIRDWWRKYPDANVAVACGQASDGLICVDLDEDDEKDEHGTETLRDWEAEHGVLPDTWRILTPRGGVHLLFKEEPGDNIRNRNQNTGGFFKDIDVRANGGYVVMPPSVVNNKPYEFEYGMDAETDLADVNDIVREFVHWDREETGDRGEKSANAVEGKRPFKAADEIPEGCRVSSLVSAIGKMMKDNFPEDGIRAMIETMNQDRCKPPLTDTELEKTVFPALKRDWRPDQAQTAESPDFAEFISLAPDLESKLPPFPRGVLPEAIEAHAAAVAESLQVPFDMPAICDLGALSTSAAGNFAIEIKPDWREPPNVFAALIARPSEKKSPVNKEATWPLAEFVRQENRRRRPEIAEYQTRKRILSGKIETMKTALTRGKNAAGYTERDMIDLQIELDALEEVNELELVLDDTTPEALTRALKRKMSGLQSSQPRVAFLDCWPDAIRRIRISICF